MKRILILNVIMYMLGSCSNSAPEIDLSGMSHADQLDALIRLDEEYTRDLIAELLPYHKVPTEQFVKNANLYTYIHDRNSSQIQYEVIDEFKIIDWYVDTTGYGLFDIDSLLWLSDYRMVGGGEEVGDSSIYFSPHETMVLIYYNHRVDSIIYPYWYQFARKR